MRISDASHHLKKTSLWDYGNQADAEAVLTTTDILNKATATIRASLGVNNPENIWGSLGQHLEKHLLQLKAANIKNFGAFGFNQNNGLAFVQDPVFLHMTRLCLVSRKRGDLVAPALRHSEQVLDIDVNELAAEYLQNCSNDLVKAVISSVFAWVTAWAKDGQQMRLSFHPVGEWICDGESVDFRFSELFREGIALKKAAMEQQGAEIAETTDSGVGNMNDNQFDEQESLGDQTTCPPRSARNPVGTEELDYISAKNNLSVDIFPSAAKVSAVQSGSPVGRSRYKLRAPTFASIAKQLPPHGQRRKKRADASVEVVSSNSKGEVASKKKPSTDRGVARTVKQVGSATPGLNPIDIDTATEDILAAPYQFGVGNWPTLDNMCRRLGANRVLGDGNEIMNAKAFSNSLATLDKRLTPKDAVDLSCFVADHCAPSLGNSDSIVLLSLYRMLTTVWSEKSTSDPVVDYNYVEYYASRAIERIRIRVNGSQTRTTHAEILPSVDLKALEKWLQAFSSNGDSLLMKYELRNGLMKVGIDISYQDLDYLFAYFDVDRQGYINYEPFLEALRSPSNMLPKLARHQEKSLTHAETKPENDAPLQQPAILKYTAAPQRTTRRGQQVAPQPNFRRRNLIHRAIWDQSTKKEKSDTSEEFDKLEMERRRRYQAARIIQTTFRAFRARHIAAQLRRKAAAKTYRVSTLALEHEQLLTKKKKANRTALPTAYGF
ncbi:hypothetical protein PR003_g14114 [Phytophthora rubi]|uniref:EF-hand domain-containing protein n=1 Tax=Phytophthora rubi TaxID=129364 RepID=A0A6A4F0E9_9STRA|nr:hypothetical protein PR002_g13901 [Phytophthora rubi]KAE9333260.1 hypothetical protein PR003_g14114 [Phytophthora rubi]